MACLHDGLIDWSVPVEQDQKYEKFRMLDLGKEYSDVSNDTNPIHFYPLVAGVARLPGPITHGMYKSAIVCTAIERVIARSKFSRFRRRNASFEDIVRTRDILWIEMRHAAHFDARWEHNA